MKTVLSIFLALLLALSGCGGPARWTRPVPNAPTVDATKVAGDVEWLADNAREGRGLGTAGLDSAAGYLADGFRDAGLEPGGRGGAYLSPFEMPVAIRIARAELTLGETAFVRGRDFEAYLSSADGEAAGEVVFAGYGISADRLGYDDYAGLDAAGKIALVLDYRPADATSPLAGAAGAPYLSRAYKALNARRHGAAAVLIAPSVAPTLDVVERLPRTDGANPTLQPGETIALAVSRAAAEQVVAAAQGPTLAVRQAAIDASGRPGSAPLAGVRARVRVQIERRMGTVANVVGILRGGDPALSREAVVVGAHYDHLGRGEFGSLAPDRLGEVHPGADDNASGAAGLLALARAFTGATPPPPRTLVLVAFTGEEAGLVGSSEYVRNPAWPLADTIAMVNLDMIGRLREQRLTVFGADTSPAFESLVKHAAAGLELTPSFENGAFGPSDQTSFYGKGVPVLFFFTGTHPQYHTPDDQAALVNAVGEAQVLQLVYRTVAALLAVPERPVALVHAQPSHAMGPAQAGPGYGPYLGTIPEFGGPPVRGVRIQGVRTGSPAEAAGLRAGDVIVEFDGAAVANLEEFSALLFTARPGQRVEIEAVRDGARIRTAATLGQRR
ncbi:MAG TPA: M20/M25/M40 family metallo-hydrolase [Myxococcota bacterium]|nr:M20/M25/M40 family metallo-hydrolase [Myxococcota bacterium]